MPQHPSPKGILLTPVLSLSCLAYLYVALPGSALGLLWPSMRASIDEPVSALGVVLVVGVITSAASSAVTGRMLSRTAAGLLLAAGTAAVGVALAVEAVAPALWVIVIGSAVFGLGFGTLDAVLNAYAAGHFDARDITWMHASYGLGATLSPLIVTALLGDGVSWRGALTLMAGAAAVVTVILAVARRRWEGPPVVRQGHPAPPAAASHQPGRRQAAGVAAGLVFIAVETGIESAAGTWGYIFLTSGRGLPAALAGIAVSAYWAMMFAGRALLGSVARRLGAARVLAGAVVSVPLGALLMAVPGPALAAVAGMIALGLAAAPVFPLFILTAADRAGAGAAATVVGLQAAASAVGSAALPSGIGLIIGAVSANALGPSLLAGALAMCGVYWLTLRAGGCGSTLRVRSGL